MPRRTPTKPWGDASIRDLSTDGVTDEEALLDLRNRATSFEYGAQIGFSLQFGSTSNNVVDNRLPSGGGGGGGNFS